MGEATISTLYVFLLILLPSVGGSTPFVSNINDTFFIPLRSLESHKDQSFESSASNDHALETRALDEKCKKGQPMSLAWFQYPPYSITLEARTEIIKEDGVMIQGMLPEILSDILKSCCNKSSRVTYGKMLETSWQIDELSRRQDHDFVLPLHSFDTASKSVRGRPFVALVQAPRVVLLVHDVSSVAKSGYVVVMTVARAWPLLTFLMVMALLASVIVWFLVGLKHFSLVYI